MSYKVRLNTFEGPFDLLVYLIENAQMSIYDIQVSEITSQYLEYLGDMQRQNVTLSSEFMVLAAGLLELKSKMMLPSAPVEEGSVVEDPRTELAERLMAYKICKAQSELLAAAAAKQAGVFEKPQEDISVYTENPDEFLNLKIDDFARAFDIFLHRKQKIEETRRHYTKVERERETIENRMKYIRETVMNAIRAGQQDVSFRDLMPKESRYDVAVSFTSLLQMMRERYLDAEQDGNYGEILVHKGAREFEEEENNHDQ